MKFWVGLILVVLIVAGLWLGLVYGKEILDDTKKAIEENFTTNEDNTNTGTEDDTTGEETGNETLPTAVITRLSVTGNSFDYYKLI